MLPRVPGSENAFLLPFAPTAAYADEEDPFKVLVLSRTMFGVVVIDVANKNMPIKGAQVTLASRYAAGKQLSATTDDEGTAIFEVAPLSEGYVDEATLLDAYDFNGGCRDSPCAYPGRHRHNRAHASAFRRRAVLPPAHIRRMGHPVR